MLLEYRSTFLGSVVHRLPLDWSIETKLAFRVVTVQAASIYQYIIFRATQYWGEIGEQPDANLVSTLGRVHIIYNCAVMDLCTAWGAVIKIMTG
jgi:hypothetical protein